MSIKGTMKVMMGSAVLAVAMLAAVPAVAEEAEERVEHFEVSAPKTVQEAYKVLDMRIKDVLAAHAKGDHDAIHEYSYDMEAAIGKLERHIMRLKDTTEEMHLASEDGDQKVLDTSIPEIKKLIEDM